MWLRSVADARVVVDLALDPGVAGEPPLEDLDDVDEDARGVLLGVGDPRAGRPSQTMSPRSPTWPPDSA